MPTGMPAGNMVVDLGGGTAEAAVIAVNGIVVSSSVRVGGNRIDEAIITYIRKKYNLIIGDQTAEQIKVEIGSALPLEQEKQTTVQGRDHVTGLPRTIEVDSGEVTEALSEPLAAIVGMVKNVLSRTPPELASDILERGIILTGGGALLRGLDKRLREETNLPVNVAEDPLTCVARGTGRVLEDFTQYTKVLEKSRRD